MCRFNSLPFVVSKFIERVSYSKRIIIRMKPLMQKHFARETRYIIDILCQMNIDHARMYEKVHFDI
jgi:hypothetical protein